jgi:hypothetical protein
MIRKHPAKDPGWNKIFNITGVVQDDLGRYSFAGFILSAAGTTGALLGKHRSSADINRG